MFKTKKEKLKFEVYCILFAVIMVVLVLINKNIIDLIYLVLISMFALKILIKLLKK